MSFDIENIKNEFAAHVQDLQNQISEELKRIDTKINLNEDIWERKDFAGNPGGGGITRAFEGEIFENAGVNTSLVFGEVDPKFAANIGGDNNQMWATGISLIIHPTNPRVPTTHANFRMIQAGSKVWFGGGADLTPFYPHEDDFEYFHKVWKDACEPYGHWDEWKEKCDNYFVNKHRADEMRGIGGFFYDHFFSGDPVKDLAMFKEISSNFIKSYFPIVEQRMNEEFDDEDVDFQLHRRGRYVEFNLLHDRGTHFGLKSNGRTDSILISLPKRVKFTYRYEPKKPEHKKMMEYYFPKDWA